MEFEPGKLDLDPAKHNCQTILEYFGFEKPYEGMQHDEKWPIAILHIARMMDEQAKANKRRADAIVINLDKFLTGYEEKMKEVDIALKQLKNFKDEVRERLDKPIIEGG